MRLRRTLAVMVLLAACAGSCRGDDLHDIQRACFERAFQHQGVHFQAFNFHWFEECIQEAFSADRFHFTVTTVAPGAGLFAGGVGSGRVFRIKGFEFMGAATAALSTDSSPLGMAQMTFAVPSPGFRLREKLRGKEAQYARYDRYGLRTLDRKPGDDPVDAKLSVTLRFRTMDAREQDFYGLGPSTTRSGLAGYGLILSETYAGVNQPVSPWSTIGFDFSFLQPRVTSSTSDEPQMRTLYTEATAPGLTVRDDFARYEPYVTFRVPAQRSTFTEIRIGYAFYHALGDPRLSFERLSGTSKTTIPLEIPNPSHNTPSNRTGLANFLCPTVRNASRCSMGDVTLTALVSAAYTSAGSQVPFYFDSSLGGTDMDGNDVLRGFAQYRFRAPSAVLFQVDYRHPIWRPVGLLSFYDMGKVVQQRSDVSFAQLRHDIGIGLYLHAGNRELARVYIGFGTGEPARPSFKPSTSF